MPRPFSAYQRAVKQKRRVRRAEGEGAVGSRHMKPASVGEICSAVFCRRVGQNNRTQTPKSLPAVSERRVSEQSGGGRECARAIEHDQRACGQWVKTKTRKMREITPRTLTITPETTFQPLKNRTQNPNIHTPKYLITF